MRMGEGSAEGAVQVSVDKAVATLTLDWPDRGNGLNVRMKTALKEAVSAVAVDESVRAVVLTGAGRSFCVGQDLAEHAAALDADPHQAFDTVEEHYNPVVRGLAEMPKPVIAAINGTCVGAGLGFALACDLRVAAAGARFATAFTGIGLTCDSGLSASLARAVGTARAAELVLLGETFTAEQASEWGLVTRVVSAEELPAVTATLAARLAEGPTLAYAEAKRALTAGAALPLGRVLEHEAAAQARLGPTSDHRDAVWAFLAKRRPVFTAR